MELKTAGMISVLLHPILLPFYLLVFLLFGFRYEFTEVPLQLKLLLTGVVIFTTLLLPLFFIWILRRTGYIRSFRMVSREERPYPLIIMAIFYYATYYVIRDVPVSPVFNLFLPGASLLAGLTAVISLFSRISLHMTGLGGICGLFYGLALHPGLPVVPEMIIAILIAGITGYARLAPGEHTPREIYSGFGTGLVCMTLVMLMY